MRRNEDSLVKTVVTVCQRQGALLKLFFFCLNIIAVLAVLFFHVYGLLPVLHDSVSFVYMSCVFVKSFVLLSTPHPSLSDSLLPF